MTFMGGPEVQRSLFLVGSTRIRHIIHLRQIHKDRPESLLDRWP